MLKHLLIALAVFFSLNSINTTANEQISPYLAKATFAGGCFWCMEQPFETAQGVIGVVSGYTGGTADNPTYEEVSAGKTGHFEAVQIEYDPRLISYEQLLDIFW
ncbi:MAG: peptide-methionine (S)-S-oxide reductase, partial [Gammaproteobacteria bacterium]